MTKSRPRIVLWLVGALVVVVGSLLVWIGQVTHEPSERRELANLISVAQQAMQGQAIATEYTTQVSGSDRVVIDATLRDQTTGEQAADLLDHLAETFSSTGAYNEKQELPVNLEWTLGATAMRVTVIAYSVEGSQGFVFAETVRDRVIAATSRAGEVPNVALVGDDLIVDYGTVDRVPTELSSLDAAGSGSPGSEQDAGGTKSTAPNNGLSERFNYQNWEIVCPDALCGSASEFEAFIAALPPSTGQTLQVTQNANSGSQNAVKTWILIGYVDAEDKPKDATITQENAGGLVAALDRLCADPDTRQVEHGYGLFADHPTPHLFRSVSYICTADGLQVNPDGSEKELAEELLAAARQG